MTAPSYKVDGLLKKALKDIESIRTMLIQEGGRLGQEGIILDRIFTADYYVKICAEEINKIVAEAKE